jgi:hypothetical protein
MLASATWPRSTWAAELAQAPVQTVEIRGKLVCLPEYFHRAHGTELGAEHEHIWGFRATDGQVYTLLRTKFSESLFIDPELREQDLLLKGRVFAGSHVLEVTRTWSIREGVVHDLFYYCTVCSIESVSAGPCACCQGTVERRETPLSDRK